MTDEERNRRFENALTTPSGLAANQEGRLAALEGQAADFRRLFVNHERRVGVIEEAFQTAVELIRRHGERMDEMRTAQGASQAEVEQKTRCFNRRANADGRSSPADGGGAAAGAGGGGRVRAEDCRARRVTGAL